MERNVFLHVIKIARLSLDEKEIEEFLQQINEIESLVSHLKDIELGEECEEMEFNPLREDKEEKGEEILSVFPKRKERYLEVPKNL